MISMENYYVYCVGCRSKTKVDEPKIVETSWPSVINKIEVKRNQLIGKCSVCTRKVAKFLPSGNEKNE